MIQQQIPVVGAKCSTYLSSHRMPRGDCLFAQGETEAQKSRGILVFLGSGTSRRCERKLAFPSAFCAGRVLPHHWTEGCLLC